MRPYESLGWVRRGRGVLAEFRTHHHEAPDGTWVGRDRLHQPPSVVVVPLVDDDVLLVEQWRDAAGDVLREAPAGRIDPGETAARAAIRECEEEIGHTPGTLVPLGRWHASPGISDEVMAAFLATDLREVGRRPDGLEEEGLAVVRVPFEEAVADAAGGRIGDLKTVAALLAAARTRD